jgi:hypothetical protein
MSTQVQYRRGSGAQVAAFTGALGEMVVDTTNWILNVADGVTVGGYNMVGTTATQTLTNKTYNGVSLSVSGNVTANYLLGNAALVTGLSSTSINSGTSNVSIVSSGGNVSIGVGGNNIALFTSAGIENAQANGTGNIGTATTYFNTVFAKATSAQYADLAEMYVADQTYAPGTVIEFGGAEEVQASQLTHNTAVAGIVSTNPSYLMNATLSGNHVVAVALVGRVPCRVVGTINKGDRLVAGDLAGVATVLDNEKYQPGCIIGKALEAYNSVEVGVIEVAVGRT